MPLQFSKDLDAHNPNTPEWREDIGLVVSRLLSKVPPAHHWQNHLPTSGLWVPQRSGGCGAPRRGQAGCPAVLMLCPSHRLTVVLGSHVGSSYLALGDMQPDCHLAEEGQDCIFRAHLVSTSYLHKTQLLSYNRISLKGFSFTHYVSLLGWTLETER